MTKALKTRFTFRALSVRDLGCGEELGEGAAPAEELKSGAALGDSAQIGGSSWRLEHNLVTFSSNVLKVYALPDHTAGEEEPSTAVELRLSTQFNGRILDVIKVPTEPFLRDEYLAQ